MRERISLNYDVMNVTKHILLFPFERHRETTSTPLKDPSNFEWEIGRENNPPPLRSTTELEIPMNMRMIIIVRARK
jgi:hypothetical protein